MCRGRMKLTELIKQETDIDCAIFIQFHLPQQLCGPINKRGWTNLMEHREFRQCPPDRPPGRLRRRCTERRSRRRWQGRHLRERPETSGWRAWREPLGDPRLAQLRDLVMGEDLEMSRKKRHVSSVNVHRWRLALERKNMQRPAL